ncbi:hypothetical protein [Cellulomonas sp. Leaf334]|uniref:hypothetical protein n=1 Tax=Cellulomonas sp. Leaf334 TaxID=1736339 RepID=UPI0006F36841|nr:hypothetical protein [Cellulomonas sp. Leaf334]KQR17309.1 hypothetical protein ASF78_08465 [Cellulomonas sp. Leaf334]
MFVVLCDLDDSAALWLDSRFRELGQKSVLVTSGLLSFARRRSQWIGRDGTRAVVDLGEGGVIDQPDLVVNRLLSPPTAAWQWAEPGERDYAGAELTAFTLSWLAAVPGVVRNRPSPTCLAGPSPHPLRAAVVAHRAGLDVPDADVGAGSPTLWLLEAAVRRAAPAAGVAHLVVLDGRIVDAEGVERRVGARLPEGFPSAVARFAAAVGAAEALIGIDVVVAQGRWWFAGMTPLPDLMLAGDALVQDLIGLDARVVAR